MRMKEIRINYKTIGINSPVFLIAEAGVNHNGDLKLAKKLIEEATEAKADAIKFQTFITDNVVLKHTPKVNYQKTSNNNGESLYEMAKKYEFGKEEFKILKDYCCTKGIIFLSTPYDEQSIDWLDELGVPAYKVSSGDLNNFHLLKLICRKKKPIFLSTGMATLEEVKETVNFLTSNEVKDLAIFHCTTNYPTPYNEINLNIIDTYKKEFSEFLIGFSDHSLGIIASIGAAAKGVKLIEKHFTLDKNLEGPDHKASLDPEELKKWVINIRKIEKLMGSYEKIPMKSELIISKIARRSIVTMRELKKGDYIQLKDLTTKRPAVGIPPDYFYKIIGKRVKNTIPRDEIITWDDLE